MKHNQSVSSRLYRGAFTFKVRSWALQNDFASIVVDALHIVVHIVRPALENFVGKSSHQLAVNDTSSRWIFKMIFLSRLSLWVPLARSWLSRKSCSSHLEVSNQYVILILGASPSASLRTCGGHVDFTVANWMGTGWSGGQSGAATSCKFEEQRSESIWWRFLCCSPIKIGNT